MAASLSAYVSEFEGIRRASGSEPSRLVRTREEALNRFVSLGFPTTHDEEWRFTSVAPIANRTFSLDAAPSADVIVDPLRLSTDLSAELVFVNGHYSAALSRVAALPPGVVVESLASALTTRAGAIDPYLARLASFDQQAFTAMNTALFTDGAFIQIPPRTVLEHPIHVLFVSSPTTEGGRGKGAGARGQGEGDRGKAEGGKSERALMSHPRVLIVMGEQSQASLVESYAGPNGGCYFTNTITEISLAENAVLDHYKMQHESAQGYHVGAMHIRAQRNANFTSHSIGFGGSLVRNDVIAVLDGEGVECTLNGLYLAGDQRLVDNHTTIDHAKPHCGSREIYKGILTDHARGVFNGKIIVRPDAQKTDAKQTNRALLLSEDAQINTKPQLEIFANDVKCTHGAAVGQLDDEAVFYLRSRGLSAVDARHLLIHAFAADVLNRMALEPLRASVEHVLHHQLSKTLAAAA